VACGGEKGNAYRVLVWKREGLTPLEYVGINWSIILKWMLKK
jgi:hypothetical protein